MGSRFVGGGGGRACFHHYRGIRLVVVIPLVARGLQFVARRTAGIPYL